MPPSGMTSAGTSLLASLEARHILAHARTTEIELQRAADALAKRVGKPIDQDIHFVFLADKYGVVEARTHTAIRLA